MTPCPIHAVAVAAFIRKLPKFVVLAAVHNLQRVSIDFCPITSEYSGFFLDHNGLARPMYLNTSAQSSSTISVLWYLKNGTALPPGVEIISMDLVKRGNSVRVVLSSRGVRQSILVPRLDVVWGVVTFAPDPEVEELFQ
jgi:hypothetical protein